MHKLNHRNVLNLIGVSAGKEDIGGPLIVLPYTKNRDLKSYLCNKRKQCDVDKDEDCTVRIQIVSIDFKLIMKFVLQPKKLLSYVIEICSGMEYLSTCSIIHRDLAARNCM